MEYSAESIHYLHIAFAMMIAVQTGYAAWLVVRWNRVTAERAAIQNRTHTNR